MIVNIPEEFFDVEYKASRIPGVENQSDLSLGANCQVFAFELLRVNGLHAKNVRSDELWSDTSFTKRVDCLEPLDVMLYSENGDSFGAHVGVYLGDGKIIHLSLENGKPKISSHQEMLINPKHRHYIGSKRIKKNNE